MAKSIIMRPHELETVDFLLTKGHTIELLRPTLTPRNPNPDMIMDGLVWEMKSPTTANKATIKRLLKEASRQSANIVVDLRRAKISGQVALNILKSEYRMRRSIRRVIVITKENEELLLSK